MKLPAIILVSSLMMTTSVQAMETSELPTETTPLRNQHDVPPCLPIPDDCRVSGPLVVDGQQQLNIQAFKYKHQSKQLSAHIEQKNRDAARAAQCQAGLCCARWIFVCPYACFVDCIKPYFCHEEE